MKYSLVAGRPLDGNRVQEKFEHGVSWWADLQLSVIMESLVFVLSHTHTVTHNSNNDSTVFINYLKEP